MKNYFLLLCLLVFALFSFQKSAITVSGLVMDDGGNAIAGAVVQEKGRPGKVVTDANGSFTINILNEKATLVISAVGYATQQVKVGKQTTLHIVLKPATDSMQEVVVTGMARGKSKLFGARQQMAMAAPPVMAYDVEFSPGPESHYSPYNREGYEHIAENRFLKTQDNPLSTFSIDVDAASYSNVRRMLNYNQLPPAGAVRIEEMINYFTYNYPQPTGVHPFSVNTEMAVCPWNTDHKLVSIGLQGKQIPVDNLPSSNLVFLIDVSGSMESEDKLPLVKASMRMLTDQLRQQDKVSIVVYAGNAGLVLPATPGSEKATIKNALDRLQAGGSTAGGQGIKLAYKIARENLVKNGNNRVILCTDGDFNVGQSSDDELVRMIEKERESGVFLTILGFGTGNYQDAKMQKLSNKGNGNHAYIDNMTEAKKVLVNEFGGTMFTIAKDVKLQVEFNPAKVQGYRLIGYENRMLAKEDFNNDKKDAGEMGSNHTVTALYEIIPASVQTKLLDSVDELRYQKPKATSKANAFGNEVMNIKLRYKLPNEDVSKLLQHPVKDASHSIENTSGNLRLAAAVAQFGMLLRNSEFKGNSSYEKLLNSINELPMDAAGYNQELVLLVKKANKLQEKNLGKLQ